MDNRDALKSMLNSLINDKPEDAAVDFHSYVTAKMQSVAGTGQAAQHVTTEDDSDADDGTE